MRTAVICWNTINSRYYIWIGMFCPFLMWMMNRLFHVIFNARICMWYYGPHIDHYGVSRFLSRHTWMWIPIISCSAIWVSFPLAIPPFPWVLSPHEYLAIGALTLYRVFCCSQEKSKISSPVSIVDMQPTLHSLTTYTIIMFLTNYQRAHSN